MNKNNIKSFAVWARNELISRVTQKAYEYGVEKDNIIDANSNSINGKLLTETEKKQRQQFITEVNKKGFYQVIEEVAYTWFNRFIALRYMEVNKYLPNRIRIFTNENNEFKPQIIDEVLNIDLPGLDKELIFKLLESNNQEELYKQLIIATCNDMGNYLPGMFTRISDYNVLLFPDNILKKENIIGKMISDIDEDSWLDQVQILGWLYQFYNTEPKEKVYARPKGQKIGKNDIPAVTQLFTPDWIVKYMVENSLGRLWLNGHPNELLRSHWRYYLEETDQEESVKEKLNKIKKEHSNLKVEEIKVIDPCMGSGHILVYTFEVLMQIYKENGYSERDAAVLILENNLYGLDIDERAYQLSYFAVMMKARQYNRRVLTMNIKPQLYVFEETTEFIRENLFRLGELKDLGIRIANDFKNAKELGSILKIDYNPNDLEQLSHKLIEIDKMADYGDLFTQANSIQFVEEFSALLDLTKVMSNKYDVVVTNPPYMVPSDLQKTYALKHYPNSKTDLFAMMIEQGNELTKNNGYNCMVTMQAWMFLTSYEKMRQNLINKYTISNLMQMENMVMGIAFGTSVTCILNNHIKEYKGTYNHIKLCDIINDVPREFPIKENRFAQICASKFSKIPGSPIAYWASNNILNVFSNGKILKTKGDTRQGMATSDNNRFLRLWYEVEYSKLGLSYSNAKEAKDSKKKWFPYNKGGEYRKWYGNIDYTINYENDGFEVKEYASSLYKSATRTIKSISEYFKPCLSWSKISSGSIAFRYYPQGFIFDVAGCCIFYENEDDMYYDFGFINSNISKSILSMISPTLNYEAGHIASLPIIREINKSNLINAKVKENIKLSKADWDSFETSWNFDVHPLVKLSSILYDATSVGATMNYYYGKHIKTSCPLELCYMLWQGECNERFSKIKQNEEELNQIFIDIYELKDELSPCVESKNITIRKADLTRDIKSFISYAVGCMFGRYSLDVDKLVYAGGEWDERNYNSFRPDKDNIIPICDDEYFNDDIVNRFIKFVEVIYGIDSLEDNLKFIANVLGGKGNPREVLRQYFLNDFFKDHCNMYQVNGSGKRPIYWLFDSGKKNGFKALVYIHRYSPDLIARMRTHYIHEQQARYRNQIEMLENQIDGDISTSERVRLNKKIKYLKEQDEELRVYEEKIHHWADKMEPMDLDDGVKLNYAKFQELLAKIK